MTRSASLILDQEVRDTTTERIFAHARRGWPGLPVLVRHHGAFCYIAAELPGYREPSLIGRLRYQGPPDRWIIAIYKASSETYREAELPTGMGPLTVTPEQGLDHALAFWVGPPLHS
jgi:hypothetical protein